MEEDKKKVTSKTTASAKIDTPREVAKSIIPEIEPVKSVEVPEDKLKKIYDILEKQNAELSVLRQAADQKQINRIEALRNNGKLAKSVNINLWKGKIINGWRSSKDEVYVDNNGVVHEDQRIELHFEDGDPEEVSIRQFYREKKQEKAEVIKESKDSDGNVSFTVMFKDGREKEIDSKFVN